MNGEGIRGVLESSDSRIVGGDNNSKLTEWVLSFTISFLHSLTAYPQAALTVEVGIRGNREPSKAFPSG